MVSESVLYGETGNADIQAEPHSGAGASGGELCAAQLSGRIGRRRGKLSAGNTPLSERDGVPGI